MFSYTNHTLMPEALETWPVELLGALLPRHLEIIYELNARFLDEVEGRRGGHGDDGLSRRVSLIDELGERRVRMANLCVLASSKVNGVSRLHTELMRQTVFADFATLFPGRIVNKTNGITPRRWLGLANPPLTRLIDERIGPGWRADLERLSLVRPLAADAAFREDFRAAKAANKRRLIDLIRRETGALVDPDSLFDDTPVRLMPMSGPPPSRSGLLQRATGLNRSRGRTPRAGLWRGGGRSSAVTGWDRAV